MEPCAGCSSVAVPVFGSGDWQERRGGRGAGHNGPIQQLNRQAQSSQTRGKIFMSHPSSLSLTRPTLLLWTGWGGRDWHAKHSNNTHTHRGGQTCRRLGHVCGGGGGEGAYRTVISLCTWINIHDYTCTDNWKIKWTFCRGHMYHEL